MGIEDYEDTFKILKEIKNLPSSIKRIGKLLEKLKKNILNRGLFGLFISFIS